MESGRRRGASDGGTLWLVGMMGSGKSTVGALVARALDVEFIDLDASIARSAGSEVARLVGRDEPAFRALEAAAVRDVAGRRAVVATGGGTVLDPASAETMRGTGVVVWLDAGVDVLAARVGAGRDRPLLGDEPRVDLAAILSEREPVYRATAHAIVGAEDVPEVVAAGVVDAWRSS